MWLLILLKLPSVDPFQFRLFAGNTYWGKPLGRSSESAMDRYAKSILRLLAPANLNKPKRRGEACGCHNRGGIPGQE